MSITLPAKHVTAEEFATLDENERYNLIKGELQPMPPMPGARHGDLTMTLSSYATIYVLENDLGRCFAAETRFIVERNPDTTLGPDWAFVRRDRLPEVIPDGFLELAPDIVLEVRSPSDRRREVEEKIAHWLAAGVQRVWEIDPPAQILAVYRADAPPQMLGPSDTLTEEDLLPGFAFALYRLFRKQN